MTAVIPKVSQLTPRILRVLGCNPGPMTLQGTNTYLIGTGARRLLLDTGEPNIPEYLTSLKSVLETNKIEIEKIVISHWHHDHIGGLEAVLESCAKNAKVYKFPRPEDDVQTVSIEALNDKQDMSVEGATLKVRHTPGHTTDHVILELVEDGAIFSNDCILGEGTAVFEDLHSYMASLKVILDMDPKVIYPGHGPVVENPVPKIEYYISHRQQRESQVLEVLTKSAPTLLTPMQLVEIIYTETPKHLYPAAANNVSHHLSKLIKDGKVKKGDVGGEDGFAIADPKTKL